MTDKQRLQAFLNEFTALVLKYRAVVRGNLEGELMVMLNKNPPSDAKWVWNGEIDHWGCPGRPEVTADIYWSDMETRY